MPVRLSKYIFLHALIHKKVYTEIQPYITADKLHRPKKGEKASNIDIMSGPYNG